MDIDLPSPTGRQAHFGRSSEPLPTKVPLLDACVAEQVAAAPAHLILDLQPVRFLASTGLTSLLRAHELAETTGTQLHLAGLVTRVVARALHVTELLDCFDTYPTLTNALAVVTD